MGIRVIAGVEMIHQLYSPNLAQATQQEGPQEWARIPAGTPLRLSGEISGSQRIFYTSSHPSTHSLIFWVVSLLSGARYIPFSYTYQQVYSVMLENVLRPINPKTLESC